MTDSKARAAEPSILQGLARSPVREATRRENHKTLLQIVSIRLRAVYLDTRRVRSKSSRLA